ncbi:GntR family transcriptional regulator [Streptomyces capillispiralis]|uniref:DNA-binding GntR family transcriptional regulator n=1 Tax=Streptomyces capillispiralis TaxID=68182 RepID=A0A561TB11_9ACTN|nr:GntR family transcriptional regulator [Streptomyces capillispiralis]TWF84292.1 DNA-binding GntR family transcriptional regulator [Streptomyces capillispiralis]GHH91835.1 GntR family transcriptional regulator [Streptomyces capillispiralis]
MKQGTQGSAWTGNAATGPAGEAARGRFRVPAQPTAQDADRPRDADRPLNAECDRRRGGPHDAEGGTARGEHTHGEPAPRPARPAVQRSSVRGQILAALRTALVTGDLSPGEVYSAPVLAERFGVSATPVREAMQQLTLEGAVEVVPNRGFRVVERGARELAELAEVRALIEVPVMLRLARTVPAARWAELRPLAEATVRAASSGCRATYAEADRAFHGAVLGLAGNEQLVRIAEDLHRRAQWPLVGSTPGTRGRAELVADAHEHTALLDALIAGDLEVVRSLVSEHFTGAA